jgi:hypothetical protein
VMSPQLREGKRRDKCLGTALYSARDALTALHSACENLAQELARRDVER